ncbi:MAG: hypothetical protein E6J58_05630 [Deltaproteobacteria bacterium]|nr:MAG: hypothetical protein E6J58_05630 [Deltaproteobacteria bacterium]
MPDQNYSGMTVNERLFAAGLLDDFDAAVMRWDKEAVLNLLQKVEVPTRPLRPLMRCSRIPNFMGFPSGGDHGAAQGSSRCNGRCPQLLVRRGSRGFQRGRNVLHPLISSVM